MRTVPLTPALSNERKGVVPLTSILSLGGERKPEGKGASQGEGD
jgi:hypothetical protein